MYFELLWALAKLYNAFGRVVTEIRHLIGGVGVKTAGGFIQEQNPRIGDQCNSDICPLALSS